MATYYIIGKNETPDASGTQISAGGTINPAEGDIYIVTSTADDDTKFQATGSTNYDVQFDVSNSNGFTMEFAGQSNPNITIADSVDISNVAFNAKNAESVDLTVGDGVSIKQYDGSKLGVDTIDIGDNFTVSGNFKTDGGDDTVKIGSNASVNTIDAGNGTDTLTSYTPTIGNQNFETANFPDGVVDGTDGDDTIGAGYVDAQTDAVDGADGDNDFIIGGLGGDTIEGGAGNDVIYGDLSDAVTELPDPSGTAEVDGFEITTGGDVAIDASTFSTPENENYITFTDDSATPITSVEISKIGNGDGEPDSFNFDLSTFDDDFTVTIKSEGTEDTIHVTNVISEVDNGDGTKTFTYFGDDGNQHTVTVDPGVAQLVAHIAEPPASSSINTDDIIDGGVGNDFIDGGFGDDVIDGGADDDVIAMSSGTDTIDGGDGNDTYFASVGQSIVDETVTVSVDENGDATVAKVGDGSTDTVTNVETFVADEVAGQDDEIVFDGSYLTSDVSGISDSAVGTFTTSDGVISFGGTGEPTLSELMSGNYDHPTFGTIYPAGEVKITSGDEIGQIGGTSFANFETIIYSTVCFASGTLIETPNGLREVDTLTPGDLVETVDGGSKPIRWTRSAQHSLDRMSEKECPILIRAGALGENRPRRDLVVSPQHRILVGGHGQLENIFDSEVLVPAKSLTKLPGIRAMRGKSEITWVHFAFDTHELVHAQGCVTESLLLGKMVLNGLNADELEELSKIYGARPATGDALNGAPARSIVNAGAAQKIIARQKRAVV